MMIHVDANDARPFGAIVHQDESVSNAGLANENALNEKLRVDATASDDAKSRQADGPTAIEQIKTMEVDGEFAESYIGESDAVVRAPNTANRTEDKENTDDIEVSVNSLN